MNAFTILCERRQIKTNKKELKELNNVFELQKYNRNKN
jgi:hypothetical protein